MKPRLLDLFCKAGGAGMGYHRAGFEVVGVDIEPQPHYPFEFHQADALLLNEAWMQSFDVIHSSPPCQFYSILTPTERRGLHPALIGIVRHMLKHVVGKPYVIENVPGARGALDSPLLICGTMFNLPIYWHRYFEIGNVGGLFIATPPCNHQAKPVLISGTTKRKENGKRREHSVDECRAAAEIDWMTRKELDEAIPPAYTEFIGRHLMEHIKKES